MEPREAVIVDTVRTAVGKRKGALATWHPSDLLGLTLRSLLERNDVDPGTIDDVVGGCVTQSGEQGCNVTRNAWVAAGLPWRVAGASGARAGGPAAEGGHLLRGHRRVRGHISRTASRRWECDYPHPTHLATTVQ